MRDLFTHGQIPYIVVLYQRNLFGSCYNPPLNLMKIGSVVLLLFFIPQNPVSAWKLKIKIENESAVQMLGLTSMLIKKNSYPLEQIRPHMVYIFWYMSCNYQNEEQVMLQSEAFMHMCTCVLHVCDCWLLPRRQTGGVRAEFALFLCSRHFFLARPADPPSWQLLEPQLAHSWYEVFQWAILLWTKHTSKMAVGIIRYYGL